MRLPVLMYHNVVKDGEPDFLTIQASQLERQLKYIKQKGYQSVCLQQLYNYLTKGEALPSKPVLITFDDGFKSNYQLLYPLLQQYGLKASIFLVANFIEQKQNRSIDKYLHLDDIRQMNPAIVDYGYHSFDHKSYSDLSLEEIATDIQKMQAGFNSMGLDIVPLFAYPYGAFPRKDEAKMNLLKGVFKSCGIAGAFRIGNRINSVPTNAQYNIQRIDVRGTDPFWKFKIMLRLGKKWLV